VARKLTDEVQLKLRFDERLRRRLEKAAEQHLFSMNREIIERLQQSFSAEDQAAQFDEVKRLIQQLQEGLTSSPLMKLLSECRASGVNVEQVLTEAMNRKGSNTSGAEI
jgi:hypothetical protein